MEVAGRGLTLEFALHLSIRGGDSSLELRQQSRVQRDGSPAVAMGPGEKPDKESGGRSPQKLKHFTTLPYHFRVNFNNFISHVTCYTNKRLMTSLITDDYIS